MTPVFAFIDAPIIAIIAGIAILLFGADRLPKLARSMGEAKKEFESASRAQAAPSDTPTAPPQPPTPPTSQTPAQPQ